MMVNAVGLILGIGLFVYLAYRRTNIVLVSLIASIVMILSAKMPVYEMLMGPYMKGLSNFLNSYFLMIMTSAILGRLMNDGGGAKKIAVTFGTMASKSIPKRQKCISVLLVAVLYYLFSYVGISGFVLVFTVMPIAMHLFRSTDTPWRFYCFGGPQIAASNFLAGSLNQGNIFCADVCGTGTTAGALLSVIATAVWWAVTLVLIWAFLKEGERNQETFLTDGSTVLAEAERTGGIPDEKLPPLAASAAPMLVVLVCTACFKMPITKALVIGCAVAMICLYPQLKGNYKQTLTKGVTECYGTAFTVSALYGFGSVVKQMPAFEAFAQSLNMLPGLAGGTVLGLATAFIIASTPIPIFGEQMLSSYLQTGMSAEVAHRMMTISGWTSIAPHSAGLTNSSSVTKIDYGRCLKVYMTAAYIPGIVVTLVSVLLLSTGIIH